MKWYRARTPYTCVKTGRARGNDGECTFGIDIGCTTSPCPDPTCGVCNICRAGFELERSGTNPGRIMALRYGKGVYFSGTSGKSNDYSGGTQRMRRVRHKGNVRWRAMFLCNVVAGKTHSTTESKLNDETLARIKQQGADSVEGKVGRHLNYDELVIYNPTCAVPTHPIVYALYDRAGAAGEGACAGGGGGGTGGGGGSSGRGSSYSRGGKGGYSNHDRDCDRDFSRRGAGSGGSRSHKRGRYFNKDKY